MPDLAGSLKEELFGGDGHAYTILDGAAIPDLPGKLWELEPKFECLYRGELAPDMAAVAPYLVGLEREAAFTKWLLKNAPGANWGIFAKSEADLHKVRQHFRRFLMVHDERGRPLVFRFYDPRVLRVYLATCTPAELAEFMGPVQTILSESEDGTWERFSGKT